MKYNWSIIGHEKQLGRIEQDISSGNLAHAYLLVGPNSVGKSTVAKKLAGILQCENDFCHKCKNCVQVEKDCHIDVMVLKDDKESIKVGTMRKIIKHLSMTRQSKYKVLLIQCLERMTVEAANSFLKTLEEPPENTIFIMTTNSVGLILPTIISRVRIVRFNNVSYSYLSEKLIDLYPDCDEETLNKVNLFSAGKTGKAVQLIENPEVLAEYIHLYNVIQVFLKNKNVVDRFSFVQNLTEDPGQIEVFLSILLHVLRSKILEGSLKTKTEINMLLKIREAGMLLKKNVNTRLVLENLMLSL